MSRIVRKPDFCLCENKGADQLRGNRRFGPSQGFWGFREKGYLFSGIWGEGSFIFRDLGRKQGFREQGAEEKHFRELGRKVIFLSGSREQRPPSPGRASHMSGNQSYTPLNEPLIPITGNKILAIRESTYDFLSMQHSREI